MTGVYQGTPAGVGISHLAVYDSEAPDGVRSGSAHVHLSCTEGYVVIGGRGRLQTLSPAGFQEIDLYPQQVVWFTPGVIHRLVNDGDLTIIIVMQNGGLPEAGDCVLSLPDYYLSDRSRYREKADLPAPEHGHEVVDSHARQRRDLSVTGFIGLRDRLEREGPGALDGFYLNAAALVADDLARWRELWREGAVRAAETTGDQIDALRRGDLGYLALAGLHEAQPRAGSPRAGMCGRIVSFDPPALSGLNIPVSGTP
jgi:mannose-6-phosphate isomerase-like protein (cupin superfamily)